LPKFSDYGVLIYKTNILYVNKDQHAYGMFFLEEKNILFVRDKIFIINQGSYKKMLAMRLKEGVFYF
jgi:hypothetical protein